LGPDCPVGKHLLVALNTQLTVQISSKSKLSELKLVISKGGGCDFWQVYALTKERDMLRREQNRKSDSSILLKEKDEIIKQVMAEGSVRSYGFSSCYHPSQCNVIAYFSVTGSINPSADASLLLLCE
jgi:hypothetical protein